MSAKAIATFLLSQSATFTTDGRDVTCVDGDARGAYPTPTILSLPIGPGSSSLRSPSIPLHLNAREAVHTALGKSCADFKTLLEGKALKGTLKQEIREESGFNPQGRCLNALQESIVLTLGGVEFTGRERFVVLPGKGCNK